MCIRDRAGTGRRISGMRFKCSHHLLLWSIFWCNDAIFNSRLTSSFLFRSSREQLCVPMRNFISAAWFLCTSLLQCHYNTKSSVFVTVKLLVSRGICTVVRSHKYETEINFTNVHNILVKRGNKCVHVTYKYLAIFYFTYSALLTHWLPMATQSLLKQFLFY